MHARIGLGPMSMFLNQDPCITISIAGPQPALRVVDLIIYIPLSIVQGLQNLLNLLLSLFLSLFYFNYIKGLFC